MSQQPPNQRGLSPLALPQTGKKKQRVPLGSPIQWSESDIAALADISPADLKAANALWERDAPVQMKPLLQAQVMEKSEEQ